MSTPITPPPAGDDLLAAEFAIGLVDLAEARAAEARAARDPGFASAVAWWRDRLDTLGTRPVAPPPGLWPAIATRLADNDDRAPARGEARPWRIATAAVSALAAGLLGVIVLRPAPVPPVAPVAPARPVSEPLVASLSGTRGDAVAVAFDRDTRALVVTPTILKRGRGDVELWVIPAGATKPVAIGVIDANAPSRRTIAAAEASLLVEGATMAISLEPRGGSRTGAPTGPVVATGKIVRI